jgi:hypothetical protein
MNNSTPEARPSYRPESKPNRHLGFHIAVGVAGLVLIALFIMLGWVANKQSAIRQASENHESLQAAPGPAQVGESP